MKALFLSISLSILFISNIAQINAQNCPDLPYCKFDYTIASDGFTVKFDGQASCESGLVITWDFGDGDVTSGNGIEDPTHIYSQDGDNVVKMKVNLPAPNAGCLYIW